MYWRHGRSLPYGEGVTFWALGEMVKAQAGILESERRRGPQSEKLSERYGRFVPDDAEAGWVERHLRPLAGLDTETAAAGAQHGEAFAAWRRFLEALADERPLVLVFEDLHWADEALLDFVDYLVEWASGVPLLVLCTARPELLDRRPGWGGGKVNSSTILLSPLSEDETARPPALAPRRSVIEAGSQARLLEHAGGNPLYAEEFTRMLSERPATSSVPETVQGLIAARLDTLPREEKELLCDAAVVGRAFWLGALGGERWTLEERLHSLERKEFVRRERRSSVAGEVEYSFRHALDARRRLRADPEGRAGGEAPPGGRVDRVARPHRGPRRDARAPLRSRARVRAGDRLDVQPFERAGACLFVEAGDRAFALHAFRQAAAFYRRALELWGDGVPPELLLRYGRALTVIARRPRGRDVLERALRAAARAPAIARGGGGARVPHRGAPAARPARRSVRAHREARSSSSANAPASPAKAGCSDRVVTLARARRARASSRRRAGGDRDGRVSSASTELAARALCNLGLAKSFELDFDGAARRPRAKHRARPLGRARPRRRAGSTTSARPPGSGHELRYRRRSTPEAAPSRRAVRDAADGDGEPARCSARLHVSARPLGRGARRPPTI